MIRKKMPSTLISGLLAAALLVQSPAAWLFAQNAKPTLSPGAPPVVKGNSGAAPIAPVSVNLNPSISLPGSGGLSLTPSLLPHQGQPLEISNALVLPKATPALEPVSAGLSAAEKALEKTSIPDTIAASVKEEPKGQPKTTVDVLKAVGAVKQGENPLAAGEKHSQQYDGKAEFGSLTDGALGESVSGPPVSAAFSGNVQAQHDALRKWGTSTRRTLVIAQSMSLDPDVLKGVSGIEKYEARGIAMILKARDPGVRIIFVTSKPIPQYVIDHVLKGKADADAIRSRVTFVTLKSSKWKTFLKKLNGSKRNDLSEPLSAHLLRPENRQTIDEIKGLIRAYDRPAALIPFIASDKELALSEKLGIPMYASHPQLAYWGTKSGSRRIFKEAGLPLSPGFEDIVSWNELDVRIDDLWVANRSLKRVMVKANDGVSGLGNVAFTLPAWSDDHEERLIAIRQAIEKKISRMDEEKPGSGQDFVKQFNVKGGIVEEFVEEAKGAPSPSGQAKILTDGTVSVISSHEQRLDPDGVYLGANYPADEPYREQIQDMTRKIGELLSKKGARGRFGVDYIAYPDGQGGWKVIAVEINLRAGGTTHPFVAGGLLTRSTLENGILTRPDGKRVMYNASDHTIMPGLKGIEPQRILDFLQDKDILFDETRNTGVQFHLLDAIPTKGNVGYTVVATSREEADQIEARLKELLGQLEKQYQAELKVPPSQRAPPAKKAPSLRERAAERLSKAKSAVINWLIPRLPRTLAEKLRAYALKGKSIVVVGYAVGAHHQAYLKYAKELGVKVQLIHLRESKEAVDVFAKYNPGEFIDSLVSVDIPEVPGESAQAKRERTARLALAAAGEAGIKKDGILSFVEEDVEIAGMLAQQWGLNHMAPETVRNLRDKARLRELMESHGLPTPPFARAHTEAELEAAMTTVGFPAVIKPASGSHAQGVVKVNNRTEAIKKFRELQVMIARDPMKDGDMSIDHDAGVVIEKYLEPPSDRPQGGEVDIDFIMRGGKLVFGSVTDNHPTLPGSFAPTGLNLPSRHSYDEQDRFVDLSVKTALAAGVRDGTFHFEGMLTKDGQIYLIEANPRPGGRPVWQLVRDVYGVDVIRESFMTAAGVSAPRLPKRRAEMKPRTFVHSRIVFPAISGVFQGVEGWEKVIGDPRVWQPGTMFLNKPGSHLTVSELLMDRAYVISTTGNSAEEAQAANEELSRTELRVVIDAQ